MKIGNDFDTGYVAAVIDCNSSFSVGKRGARLIFASRNPGIIYTVAEYLHGTVYSAPVKYRYKDTEYIYTQYRFVITSKKELIDVIETFIPRLRAKREEAEIFLSYLRGEIDFNETNERIRALKEIGNDDNIV